MKNSPNVLARLVMVRDADEDCHRDGLPTIPAVARAAIDAAIEGAEMKKPLKLGATGRFPEGKLNSDDEGELRFEVAFDPLNGIVRIDFGKPVTWLGLSPETAIAFAELLLKAAQRT